MVEWLASPEMRLGLSLILGLLLGAERERRKRERGTAASAGLRTFAIAGLLGGIAQYSGLPYATVAGGLAVAAFAIAGYVVTAPRESDVGQTTEIAMVLTYALGAMAIIAPAVAGTIAIVTTVLLHLRSRLHRFVSETLTDDEVEDALVFLVLAFVVLPLAPDIGMGPYAAINPQRLCRLVLVILGISASAHVAQRLFGVRYGLVASGFASGFISSSGTIAALGIRAKASPNTLHACVAGSLASSMSTVIQYILVISAVDRELVVTLAIPLALALLVAIAGTVAFARRDPEQHNVDDAPVGRAFRWAPALLVGAGSAVTAILAAASGSYAGSTGVVLVSAGSGFVDAHATAASVGTLHHAGQLNLAEARLAIAAAMSTNTVTKIGMAMLASSRAFAFRVAASVTAIAAAMWLGLWLN